jgi:hypothetical protein
MKTVSTDRTRRTILAWGGIGTLALGLAAFFQRRPAPGPDGPERALAVGSETLAHTEAVTLDPEAIPAPNHEVYSPLLNTDFTVEFPDGPELKIRLVEVTPIRTITSPKSRYQTFSLFFEAAAGTPEDGQIARVNHPKLQPMELFLAPVGRPKNGTILLEAAFTERV